MSISVMSERSNIAAKRLGFTTGLRIWLVREDDKNFCLFS